MDARGADLEVAYANVVLDACRQEPQAAEENRRATGRPPRPSVEAMQWDFLDEVNLQEIFQRKFKVLQSVDKGQASSGISCGIGGVAHRSPAGRRDEAVTGVKVVQCAALLVVAQTGFPRSVWQRRSVQFVRRRPVGNSPC